MAPHQGRTRRGPPRKARARGGLVGNELVISVDYGSACTSVAIHDPYTGAMDIVQDWTSNGRHKDAYEVPTKLWLPSERAEPLSKRPDFVEDGNQSRSIVIYAHQQPGVVYSGVRFGYVVENSSHVKSNHEKEGIIEFPKFLLCDTDCTSKIRNSLLDQTQRMVDQGQVHNVDEIHGHVLIKVLEHTKAFITNRLKYDLTKYAIKFVLTVPTIWPQRSSGALQTALETAIRLTGLGNLRNGAVEDLLIIHEPEAVMTHILSKPFKMKVVGDVVVVIDVGGGTVDAVTYSLDTSGEVRLQREEVMPEGDNCGAVHLNAKFHAHLLNRLADEDYLEASGISISTLVDQQMEKFEYIYKRDIDVTTAIPEIFILIPGLRANAQKRFVDDNIIMNAGDWKKIFGNVVGRTRALVASQLEKSFAKDLKARMVIATGGGSASPSIRSTIRLAVEEFTEELGYHIELRYDLDNSTTAVARGGALRYAQQVDGPERISQYSFGFLRKEEKCLDQEEHIEQPATRDDLDGRYYIDTINYFIFAHDTIPPSQIYGPFMCFHAFPLSRPKLICEDILYMSSTARNNH